MRFPKRPVASGYGFLESFRSRASLRSSVGSVFWTWALNLSLLIEGGCVGPIQSVYPPVSAESSRTVYVVNHGGLHTGVAVKRSDIPKNVWPANMDYREAKYIEVGWGDDDGYRKDLTTGIALKALIHSTRTVLLFDGFDKSLRENFPDAKYTIIEIKLSRRGFARLCQYIQRTHALDAHREPIRLGDDWYRARGTYCLFFTCNNWVASALRAAGCPITPAYCVTSGPLLYQARKFGRVISTQRRN